MEHRIIDIHNHPNWIGLSVDNLVKNMDEYGIERTWLLAWEATKEELDVVPRYYRSLDPRSVGLPLWMVVEGLQRHPDRFIGGWAPDPRHSNARAQLKAAVDLHGIRIYGEQKTRMRYDDQDAIAMYHYCGELGLPVLFHLEAPAYRVKQQLADIFTWPEWYGGGIDVVESMCRQCPNTTFIGHSPGFWREISSGDDDQAVVYPEGPVKSPGGVTRLMRQYPNLYADLSGFSGINALKRDVPHALQFLEEFQDRVMFGRDTNNNDLYEFLISLDLKPEILSKIFSGNALKLVPV